ncbi:MAG: NAD(P)/FAD-dependent oxidoreductase, partial [Rhodoferax sp.]
LVLLDAAAARALEPALRCACALLSPSTGIIDSHALMLALLGDVENAAGILAVNSALERARCTGAGMVLQASDGTQVCARTVVNAAGLQAPALAARFDGMPVQHIPEAHFAKGNYFTLAGRSPFSRLIYPVPEAAGLGVHLTLDLAGQARFGPDVEWVSSAHDLGVSVQRAEAFYSQIRHYWPTIPEGALVPAYAGIRPKIHGPQEPARDFCISGPATHGVPGLLHLFGIESPGLTACLAIGAHVAQLLRA